MQGLFITFEGGDGSGKTTQLRLAAAALREMGYQVVETREPGGTKLAEQVRALVLDPQMPLNNNTQALLFAAARSEHVEKVLRPALEAGKLVLCDRYIDSTLVYQGYAADASEEYLEKLYRLNCFATDGFMPQLTIFLQGKPEELLARRQARGIIDRFEAKGLDFQDKLYAGFMELAAKYPERIKCVSALGTEEEVLQTVLEKIQEAIKDL